MCNHNLFQPTISGDTMTRIHSGATPEQIKKDLKPLVDFQKEGISLDTLKELIETCLLPHLMQYDQSGFQSMFNAFPEKGAEFGAHIATVYNQGVTSWEVSPGGAVLEELCCKALCSLFGFSEKADATFMYSGTYANQEALYLALHWKAEQYKFDFGKKGLKGFNRDVVVIASDDAHLSLQSTVRMLGLGDRGLITVGVDENRRIDIALLKETIKELQKMKKDIFCIVATAGTTSTGSVDPVLPIAAICKQINAWLHVDGAYGLAYKLVPEWSPLFSGVEQANSVCWDPHKQMCVPIPNSVLFVGDKKDFNRITVHSHYFNRKEDTRPNPGLKSPPTTRPFSALPLVTSLRYQGMKKVIERLHAPLQAVKTTAKALESDPVITVCHTPDTGILCFRVIPKGVPEPMVNHVQQYIFDTIMKEGKRSISLTQLDGKTVLRLVAISPAVTSKALLETISYAKGVARTYEKRLV